MSTQPNILMIMTDQHHARCLGHRGHPDVRTPNLDALAASGVRFDECFAQGCVCVPSRTTYLTGQYPHVHGVYGNDMMGFPEGLLSLPAYLRNFGYQTAIVGKKHLPGWKSHGFDYQRLCYPADAPTRDLHYYQYLLSRGLHHLFDDLGDLERFCLPEGETLPVEHSLEAWTGRETVKYLRQANREQPFFLMCSFERPHEPLSVPDGCPHVYDPDSITLPPNQEEIVSQSPFQFRRNVELKWCTSYHGEATLRQALCNYYSLISLIDEQIGHVLQYLEEAGMRENTIVIFCADHGEFAGEYAKMAKGWNYDAIHRVPFIWSWPGRLQAGAIRTGLVETVDFFPTICDLLELGTPDSVQGQSLLPQVTTEADSTREAVFFEYLGIKSVRTKTHRLSYGFNGECEKGELVDFTRDTYEYENLFDDPGEAAVRESLMRRLLNWWIATQQPTNFANADDGLPPTRWFAQA